MTIINTYSINAGRSIAREIDDESDKSRREAKRRADAAYFADKEKLRARVREMNEQAAQVSADRFTALMQEQRADSQSRVSDRRSRIPSNEDAEQLLQDLQASPSAESNSAATAQSLGVGLRATRSDSRRPSGRDVNSLPAIVSGDLENQFEIGGVTNRAQAKDLLGGLLADIKGSPSNLTREGIATVLERLSHDISARSPREVTLKEKHGVLGYLEFLEGYFEKSETTSGPSQQIAALMENIRFQLGTTSSAVQAVEIQNLVVANQTDSQAPVQATNREQRKKQLKSNAISAEEAQTSDLDIYASAATMNSVDASRSASSKTDSSSSKDSQRRREETLVSVTLRSV